MSAPLPPSTLPTTVAHSLSISCPPADALVASTISCASNSSKHNRMISFKEHRGPSPHPSDFKDIQVKRPMDITDMMWFEEGNDLIRSCAALSSALGIRIQKSFSTSDITQLPSITEYSSQQQQLQHQSQQQSSLQHQQSQLFHHNNNNSFQNQPNSNQPQLQQRAVSELALNSLQRCGYMLDNPRLDHASRSCSTWVAVGELASTSQLPSPHGGPSYTSHQLTNSCTPPPPAFTAADLIRSVNKKVRQNYIRRRLLTTYRAIERLSQSEFNLDRLEAAASAAISLNGPGPTKLIVPSIVAVGGGSGDDANTGTEPPPSLFTAAAAAAAHDGISSSTVDDTIDNKENNSVVAGAAAVVDSKQIKLTKIKNNHQLSAAEIKKKISLNMMTKNLTIDDIEKERGKPLSKYDRNMMIFNWLHTLDEDVTLDEETI